MIYAFHCFNGVIIKYLNIFSPKWVKYKKKVERGSWSWTSLKVTKNLGLFSIRNAIIPLRYISKVIKTG